MDTHGNFEFDVNKENDIFSVFHKSRRAYLMGGSFYNYRSAPGIGTGVVGT